MDNVRANIARPLPWFHQNFPVKEEDRILDRKIALVGGGPSVKDTVGNLAYFDTIIACGSAHDWLQANSPVVPTFCAVCDPDPVMANYLRAPDHRTKYLVSSHCNASVFEALEGHDIEMWHCWPVGAGDQDARDFLEAHTPKWTAVGGGCTVGLRSLTLALMMGFSDLHFFGFDSCIGMTDDDHHAYPFTDETKEFLGTIYNLRVGMEAGAPAKREYRVAGYQLAQADHYKQMYAAFHHLFKPTFHGPGLLADMMVMVDVRAAQLRQQTQEAPL